MSSVLEEIDAIVQKIQKWRDERLEEDIRKKMKNPTDGFGWNFTTIDTWRMDFPIYSRPLALSMLAFYKSFIFRRFGISYIVITGEPDAGKSVYAIQLAHEILTQYRRRILGIDEPPKFREIIDNYMVFTVEELSEKIESVEWPDRLPVLIADDFAVEAAGMHWLIDRESYMLVQNYVETMRRFVGVFIITTPSFDSYRKQ